MRKRISQSLKQAKYQYVTMKKEATYETCTLGMKQSIYDSLLEVRQTITGFIIAFRLKQGFQNKDIKVIKSVYMPSSDVYQIYLNSYEVCLYIEDRINAYNKCKKYFDSVYVDPITDDCTALEIRINDPNRIKLGEEYNLSTISI